MRGIASSLGQKNVQEDKVIGVADLIGRYKRGEALLWKYRLKSEELAQLIAAKHEETRQVISLRAQNFRTKDGHVDLKGFRSAAMAAGDLIPSGLPIAFSEITMFRNCPERRRIRMLDRRIAAMVERLDHLLEQILSSQPASPKDAVLKAKFLCAIVVGVPGVEIDYFILMLFKKDNQFLFLCVI